MAQGKVKWFNAEKGYGFIAQDRGGPDVFVHVTEVRKAGFDDLKPEQVLSFDIQERQRGRFAAINLTTPA